MPLVRDHPDNNDDDLLLDVAKVDDDVIDNEKETAVGNNDTNSHVQNSTLQLSAQADTVKSVVSRDDETLFSLGLSSNKHNCSTVSCGVSEGDFLMDGWKENEDTRGGDSDSVVEQIKHQNIMAEENAERVTALEQMMAKVKSELAEARAQADWYKLQRRKLHMDYQDLQAVCRKLREENEQLRHDCNKNRGGVRWFQLNKHLKERALLSYSDYKDSKDEGRDPILSTETGVDPTSSISDFEVALDDVVGGRSAGVKPKQLSKNVRRKHGEATKERAQTVEQVIHSQATSEEVQSLESIKSSDMTKPKPHGRRDSLIVKHRVVFKRDGSTDDSCPPVPSRSRRISILGNDLVDLDLAQNVGENCCVQSQSEHDSVQSNDDKPMNASDEERMHPQRIPWWKKLGPNWNLEHGNKEDKSHSEDGRGALNFEGSHGAATKPQQHPSPTEDGEMKSTPSNVTNSSENSFAVESAGGGGVSSRNTNHHRRDSGVTHKSHMALVAMHF